MVVCEQCKKKLRAGRSVLVLAVNKDYSFCSKECLDGWCFAHQGKLIRYVKNYMVTKTSVEASDENG